MSSALVVTLAMLVRLYSKLLFYYYYYYYYCYYYYCYYYYLGLLILAINHSINR